MDRWSDDRDRPRHIDIGFLGGRTPRREQFIGGAAGQLWEWRTDLRFFSWHRPALAAHATFTSGDDKYRRLADTRILLNVHRDEEPYFEWARIVEAMANGCAIATETSIGITPLEPVCTWRCRRSTTWPSSLSRSRSTSPAEHGWPTPPTTCSPVASTRARSSTPRYSLQHTRHVHRDQRGRCRPPSLGGSGRVRCERRARPPR
jgi:hypothetical protein